MGEPTVQVEGIGKRYRLGVGAEGTLAESLERKMRAPMRRMFGRESAEEQSAVTREELWAVRDISFDLFAGQALGMVGANGAGKSTLLKLLSRITPPTEGRLTLRGRVSTLIEVGTGFHPELSGRDNVFLNGSILGMRRREIMASYDEIVEFSGLERFMETPVKRYSSGMYVRLAFAVAAHLDPEIMLVDEVLAVGDGEFQRKCLGKMQDVASEGRTVIFVSHDLNAVQRLCTRALLLEKGGLLLDSGTDEVIETYLERTGPSQLRGDSSVVPEDAERVGTGEARLRTVSLTDVAGAHATSLYMGQPFRVTAGFEVFEDLADISFEVAISTLDGKEILSTQTIDFDHPPADVPKGRREVAVEIDTHLLPHEFVVSVAMHRLSGVTIDHVPQAHAFTVINSNEGGGDHYRWPVVRGYVRPRATWSEVRDAGAIPAS